MRTDTDRQSLRLPPPRGRLVLLVAWSLGFVVALLGYAFTLGITDIVVDPVARAGAAALVVILLTAIYLRIAVVFGVALVLAVTGEPSAVEPDGLRLRPRPWRRLVMVPWSQISRVWIETIGGHRYLLVQVRPPGTDESVFASGRRRAVPHMVNLPDAMPLDQVRAAIAANSGGTVTVADHGPEDEPAWDDPSARRRPAGQPSVAARLVALAVLVPALLIGLPALAGVPQLWNQPWWPGVTAAADVPDACGVFTDEQASALHITGRRQSVDHRGDRECEFTVPQGSLVVSLLVSHPLFRSGTAAAAHHAMELASQQDRATPVPGLGDQAWLSVNQTPMDRSVAYLVARKANVVLVIDYRGEQEPDVVQPAIRDAAQATLAALDIH
jgi:hypothetical protein